MFINSYNFRFLVMYFFIFFIFIFVVNEFPVNEEFYISIGLLLFLIYIFYLGACNLTNYLNVRVKNDFFIFVGMYDFFYSYCFELFKFFQFDLYFWMLLNKLYKYIYNYKKSLIYLKLQFTYIYEYNKNTYMYLFLEKYVVNFYNQILLSEVKNITINSLFIVLNKYSQKLLKKNFAKKTYLFIIDMFKTNNNKLIKF